MSVQFTALKSDYVTISRIAERLEKLRPKTFDRRGLIMDLDACHSNGCPLDFERLLNFPEFDFLHDIYGIYRHLDRKTGKLQNFFMPRCARG